MRIPEPVREWIEPRGPSGKGGGSEGSGKAAMHPSIASGTGGVSTPRAGAYQVPGGERQSVIPITDSGPPPFEQARHVLKREGEREMSARGRRSLANRTRAENARSPWCRGSLHGLASGASPAPAGRA